jgi:diaminopimelate epimerase
MPPAVPVTPAGITADQSRVGQGRIARHISGDMRRIGFRKMHGLGNDFVVLDARHEPLAVGAAAARALADRYTGIGCDQLIVIEPASASDADAAIRFLNADGSEAGACGNGTRCVAWLIGQENGASRVRIQTEAGLLDAKLLPDSRVAVDMGAPRTEWRDIPLARQTNTLRADVAAGTLAGPVCTNMGNPHATFFVADADAVDLARLGPVLEHDPLFPERANIGVATVRNGEHIRLRVWERGAGITLACGSGACAAVVAASRRGLVNRMADVVLEGGTLTIEWLRDDHVLMTGGIAVAFKGELDRSLLS